MIDVSDGLIQDVGHLAESAKLGVDIDPQCVPVAADLAQYCKSNGLDPYKFILAGGEDYELAFALGRANADSCLLRFRREFRTPVAVIGTFTDAFRGVRVGGKPVERGGYDHFK